MVTIRWERPLHQAASGDDLAVGSGGLVVHERCTRLVGLDPEDGSVRWDVPTGRWLRTVVVAGQRCLVLPQESDELVCLDLATGEDVWRVGLRRWTGHVVVDGDVVLVGGWRGYTPLRALDITTGRTLWETERHVRTVRPAAGWGGFLVGEPGGSRVRLIGRRDGEELRTWSLPRPLSDHDNRRAFTAVGGDRRVVRCGDAVVQVGLSAEGAGRVVLAGASLACSAPRYAGGLLWLPERGTGVRVADARDGRVRWRIDLGQAMTGQVVAVDRGGHGGFVLAGTGGFLFLVDSRGQVVERVKVAQRIRVLRRLGPGRALAITKGTLLAAAVGDDGHHG